MVSKSVLKRRELLLRLGSASFLAIPAFRQTLAEAQDSAAPLRFIPIYLPACEGPGKFSFERALSPLAAFRSDATSFLADNGAAGAIWGRTAEPHAAALRTLLTNDSSVAPEENASVWAKSDSIDQIIAAKIGLQSKFTTLQLGVVTETKSNPLDQRRMVFKAGTPQPPVQNPTEMFTRLFGDAAPGAVSSPTEPGPALDPNVALDGKSMLDRLKAEVTALKAVAGPGEQQKLDQHLTSLRELEKQLMGGSIAAAPNPGCAVPTIAPAVYAQTYPQGTGPEPEINIVTGQQFELLYQALACDLTRVASMQLLGTAHTEVGFGWLGVREDHHALEHSGSAAAEKMDKVQSFFASEIATFLGRLKSTPEGDGNMLDNSLVYLFTDFGDATAHHHDETPSFAFGRAGGRASPGRAVPYNVDVGHGNLLWGILKVFGIDQPVGDRVDGSPILV
jgi:hypothetical protein